jgi:hypothetical protein
MSAKEDTKCDFPSLILSEKYFERSGTRRNSPILDMFR